MARVPQFTRSFSYFGFAEVSAALAECPLKVRVAANSPSLCPTMFSVTYTGTNFLPLWTAIVWPTMSGWSVDRRDQVRTTFLSFAWFNASILTIRCPSIKGPFFVDRAMSLLKGQALSFRPCNRSGFLNPDPYPLYPVLTSSGG